MNNEEKIEELISEYPINRRFLSSEELSAYHHGLRCGARQMSVWKDEQINLLREAFVKDAERKDEQYTEEKKQWIEKAAKWFEDNFKDWFEEEMMSNIIIEFKKQAIKEE